MFTSRNVRSTQLLMLYGRDCVFHCNLSSAVDVVFLIRRKEESAETVKRHGKGGGRADNLRTRVRHILRPVSFNLYIISDYYFLEPRRHKGYTFDFIVPKINGQTKIKNIRQTINYLIFTTFVLLFQKYVNVTIQTVIN